MNTFAKHDELQSAYEREIPTIIVSIASPSHAGESG
jgi:hypothetical protein